LQMIHNNITNYAIMIWNIMFQIDTSTSGK
jgi:hypothetical protein